MKQFRSQIAAYKVQGNVRPSIAVQTSNAHLLEVFTRELAVITSLVKANDCVVVANEGDVPNGCLKGFVNEEVSVFVKVVGLIDISLEIDRINKRIKELETLKAN